MVRVLRRVTARFRIFSQRTIAHEVRRVRADNTRTGWLMLVSVTVVMTVS